MVILRSSIPIAELSAMAKGMYGDLVKAVVDVERRIMALDGELHSDEEALLIEDGSKQENLWGINLYPDAALEQRIEFDSLINIRPWHGNRGRGVDDPGTKEAIAEVVGSLIEG